MVTKIERECLHLFLWFNQNQIFELPCNKLSIENHYILWGDAEVCWILWSVINLCHTSFFINQINGKYICVSLSVLHLYNANTFPLGLLLPPGFTLFTVNKYIFWDILRFLRVRRKESSSNTHLMSVLSLLLSCQLKPFCRWLQKIGIRKGFFYDFGGEVNILY